MNSNYDDEYNCIMKLNDETTKEIANLNFPLIDSEIFLKNIKNI